MLARMEAKMDANLKEMNEDIRTNLVKADAHLKEMKEELTARMEAKIEAEIKSNNDKFKKLQSTLASWIDIHQGHSRRNNSQDGCPSGKDGSQCECLAKRDNDLPRSNRGLSGE
jgi:hypothetical protein